MKHSPYDSQEDNGKLAAPNIAIALRGVNKSFRIFNRPIDRLKQQLWGQHKRCYQEFHALKEISFSVSKGETVGIVGRNGSGKSTLLQIICGTTTPSSGEVEVMGRVAALLELGAGFNPDFTGRENVRFNAAIMGMTDEEISSRFDRIAAFADIGSFMDQPVSTYSSGMYVRLAFATAINADPDILIIDEALSVGDEAFQRKCFSRIQEIKSNGGTILFVSHAASAVVELCDRAILLDAGEVLLTAKPKEVIAQYHRLIFSPADIFPAVRKSIVESSDNRSVEANSLPAPESPARSGGAFFDPGMIPKSVLEYQPRGAIISNPHIVTTGGEQVNVLVHGETYIFSYDVNFSEPGWQVRCGTLIKTVSGLELGGLMTHPLGQGLPYVEAGSTISPEFRFRCMLMRGVYFMNSGAIGIRDGEEVFLHRVVDALMFRVQSEPDVAFSGMVNFGMPEFE